MKAFLIKPEEQTIESIEIGSNDEINKLIGFDTVIADEVSKNGDRLYFDEECFLRGTEGRFQIDKLIPVSGVGVVIGSNADESLSDVKTGIEELRSRTRFL